MATFLTSPHHRVNGSQCGLSLPGGDPNGRDKQEAGEVKDEDPDYE